MKTLQRKKSTEKKVPEERENEINAHGLSD
jgi:hypothetical protein